MATITRFNDLSPELILCMFDFLSTADRYKSFFDYDDRSCMLVKKYTEFSRKELYADILRFSTLHSWYKHLSFDNDGDIYFIVPRKGQQPRYCFDPRVTDSNGLHWWFLYNNQVESILNEQVRAVITRYPFRLNPFFYHEESKRTDHSPPSRWFYGEHIILNRGGSSVMTWLRINYPEDAEKVFNQSDSGSYSGEHKLAAVFDGEWLKLTTAIKTVTAQIWKELKELDGINPLQIEFAN